MIDIPSGIRPGAGEQLFYNIGRHLLQQIRRIVRHQVIDNIGGLPLGKGNDNKLLAVHLEIGKYIRSHALWQDTEYFQKLLFLQFLHDRCGIRNIHIGDPLAEPCILLGLQQFPNYIQFFDLIHSNVPPYVIFMLRRGRGISGLDVLTFFFIKTTSFRNTA